MLLAALAVLAGTAAAGEEAGDACTTACEATHEQCVATEQAAAERCARRRQDCDDTCAACAALQAPPPAMMCLQECEACRAALDGSACARAGEPASGCAAARDTCRERCRR